MNLIKLRSYTCIVIDGDLMNYFMKRKGRRVIKEKKKKRKNVSGVRCEWETSGYPTLLF